MVREVQPLKALFSIISTLAGISIEVRDVQPEKTELSIVLSCDPFSNVTVCREVQIPYLQPIITQYFIDNKSEIWLLFLIAHSKR